MHLSSGRCEMGGGLERYTFEVAMSGIVAASERGRPALKRALAGWYMHSPRPDPREIIDFSVKQKMGGVAEVSMVIQRGHYKLLTLLHNHEDLMFKKDGSVRCSCHPAEVHWILRSQLPDYQLQFEDTRDDSDLQDGCAEDQDPASGAG